MPIQWFRVKHAIYTNADTVYLIEPGPPAPHQYHKFRCVDASGNPKGPKPEYDGKFNINIHGVGESEPIVEPGIRTSTMPQVDSRVWHWEAAKK
jgi:hypothetical protein